MDLKQILHNNYVEAKNFPKTFKWTKNLNPVKSFFKQNMNNCWIYGNLNACAINLGKILNDKDFKKYVAWFWIDIDEWWFTVTAWTLICEYVKRYNIDAKLYAIDPLKQPKQFALGLKNGYVYAYGRDCSQEVVQDILDNWIMDSKHIGVTAGHTTTLWFDPTTKLLTEYGSRWDNNKANKFTYKDVPFFLDMIRQKSIQPIFYLLYLNQW